MRHLGKNTLKNHINIPHLYVYDRLILGLSHCFKPAANSVARNVDHGVGEQAVVVDTKNNVGGHWLLSVG
jgi:hypothetical protein